MEEEERNDGVMAGPKGKKKPASWHGCPNAAGAAREDVPCDTGYEKAKKCEFDQCVKSVYYTP